VGGSQVLELSNDIYIIRHSGFDPQILQWIGATDGPVLCCMVLLRHELLTLLEAEEEEKEEE